MSRARRLPDGFAHPLTYRALRLAQAVNRNERARSEHADERHRLALSLAGPIDELDQIHVLAAPVLGGLEKIDDAVEA